MQVISVALGPLTERPLVAHSSDSSAHPNGIPEVYLQWRLQRRMPVDGAFLTVALGPRPGEMMSVAATTGLVMMDGVLRSPSNDRYVY